MTPYEQGIKAAAKSMCVGADPCPGHLRTARQIVEAFLSVQPTEWMCEYPEFNDPHCYVGHPNPEPTKTRQPRKHNQCGPVWITEQKRVST